MQLETDLELVLNKWKKRLAELGHVGPSGHLEEDIQRVEKHIKKPLPPEIRRLYETFTPQTWDLATKKAELSLDDVWDAVWAPTQVFPPESDSETLMESAPAGPKEPGWLIFGRLDGVGGNELLIWCENHPPGCSRAILGFYMEDAEPPVVLGQSLAQWLDRLLKYDGKEYAFRISDLLESTHTAFEKELFIAHHLQLNPHDEPQVRLWQKMAKKLKPETP